MIELLRTHKNELAIPFKFRGKRYKANAFGIAWWILMLGQAVILSLGMTACVSLAYIINSLIW